MEYKKTIDNIIITTNEDLSEQECREYILYVKSKNPKREIEDMKLDFHGEDVDLGYHLYPEGFEKIRRITGYLVGTVDRFNNGKAAEERDRVKHA